MASLEQHRSFFAKLLVHGAGSTDERLIAAFSDIAREDYLGPGPWWVCAGAAYVRTPDADPRWLYQDILVGLDLERRIHNGQPSLHAQCLAAAAPRGAQTVLHVGAGTGYYTAILASLVGPAGRVLAFELDPGLARQARMHLQRWPNVEVHACSALSRAPADAPPRGVDVVYVNAGVADLPAAWLDALNPGGRMIVPLTPDSGWGLLLEVTRLDADRYSARGLGRAGFTPCIGAREALDPGALSRALETESWKDIRSLVRDDRPGDSAWCVGKGWWLSRSPPREVPRGARGSPKSLG